MTLDSVKKKNNEKYEIKYQIIDRNIIYYLYLRKTKKM